MKTNLFRIMRIALFLLPLLGRGLGGGGALFAQADLSVCEGKGYTLNSTAANPPFGATSYQWYEDDILLTGKNAASLTIAAGAKTAGDYAYVRVAANADCPTGVPSNTYTVRVRAAGAKDQPVDPICDCASGLIDCSGTCTTPHPTEVAGNCTGVCHRQTVQYYTVCGVPNGSTTVTNNGCWQGCPPEWHANCLSNQLQTNRWAALGNGYEAECFAAALARATAAGAGHYSAVYVSSYDQCSQYYCMW
jgi:hypothetical protein